jgi:hypothetical protein
MILPFVLFLSQRRGASSWSPPQLEKRHARPETRTTTTTALWDVASSSSLDPLASPLVSSSNVGLRKRKDLKQFSRYLEVECWKRADVRGLEPVLTAIADACKQINRIIQRAQTDDIYGAAEDASGNPLDGTNIQGEVQQKLDVLCNTIMMRAFCGSSRTIRAVASEEEDEYRCCSSVMVRNTWTNGQRFVEYSTERRSSCLSLLPLLHQLTGRSSLCGWRLRGRL